MGQLKLKDEKGYGLECKGKQPLTNGTALQQQSVEQSVDADSITLDLDKLLERAINRENGRQEELSKLVIDSEGVITAYSDQVRRTVNDLNHYFQVIGKIAETVIEKLPKNWTLNPPNNGSNPFSNTIRVYSPPLPPPPIDEKRYCPMQEALRRISPPRQPIESRCTKPNDFYTYIDTLHEWQLTIANGARADRQLDIHCGPVKPSSFDDSYYTHTLCVKELVQYRIRNGVPNEYICYEPFYQQSRVRKYPPGENPYIDLPIPVFDCNLALRDLKGLELNKEMSTAYVKREIGDMCEQARRLADIAQTAKITFKLNVEHETTEVYIPVTQFSDENVSNMCNVMFSALCLVEPKKD